MTKHELKEENKKLTRKVKRLEKRLTEAYAEIEHLESLDHYYDPYDGGGAE